MLHTSLTIVLLFFGVHGQQQFKFFDRSGKIVLTTPDDNQVAWDHISVNDAQFHGVLNHGCSSALVRTWPKDKDPADDVPAYVLTAAHCTDLFQKTYRGRIVMDETEWKREFISKDNFDSKAEDKESIQAKVIRFATMNLTDLAIIELQATAKSLLGKKYKFYDVSREQMQASTSVMMAGFPSFGDSKMRKSAGKALRPAGIYEEWGHYLSMTWLLEVWSFPAINSAQINGWAGFSGSPVFNDKNEITAIYTQGTQGAYGYGNRADDVIECFDNVGKFDFFLDGCLKSWKESWEKNFKEKIPVKAAAPKVPEPKVEVDAQKIESQEDSDIQDSIQPSKPAPQVMDKSVQDEDEGEDEDESEPSDDFADRSQAILQYTQGEKDSDMRRSGYRNDDEDDFRSFQGNWRSGNFNYGSRERNYWRSGGSHRKSYSSHRGRYYSARGGGRRSSRGSKRW